MLGLRSLINLCLELLVGLGITSTPAFVPLVVLQDNCEFH